MCWVVCALQRVPWSEKFPEADPQALDLMDKMLQFHPGKRIDVAAALKHPWLAQLHDETQEPAAPGGAGKMGCTPAATAVGAGGFKTLIGGGGCTGNVWGVIQAVVMAGVVVIAGGAALLLSVLTVSICVAAGQPQGKVHLDTDCCHDANPQWQAKVTTHPSFVLCLRVACCLQLPLSLTLRKHS